MCRPCTAVEATLIITFIKDIVIIWARLAYIKIVFVLWTSILEAAHYQEGSIMASELSGYVDAGQLVKSFGPVTFQ